MAKRRRKRKKVKLNRSDPCPCGSGEAYKDCCRNKKKPRPPDPEPPERKSPRGMTEAIYDLVDLAVGGEDDVDEEGLLYPTEHEPPFEEIGEEEADDDAEVWEGYHPDDIDSHFAVWRRMLEPEKIDNYDVVYDIMMNEDDILSAGRYEKLLDLIELIRERKPDLMEHEGMGLARTLMRIAIARPDLASVDGALDLALKHSIHFPSVFGEIVCAFICAGDPGPVWIPLARGIEIMTSDSFRNPDSAQALRTLQAWANLADTLNANPDLAPDDPAVSERLLPLEFFQEERLPLILDHASGRRRLDRNGILALQRQGVHGYDILELICLDFGVWLSREHDWSRIKALLIVPWFTLALAGNRPRTKLKKLPKLQAPAARQANHQINQISDSDGVPDEHLRFLLLIAYSHWPAYLSSIGFRLRIDRAQFCDGMADVLADPWIILPPPELLPAIASEIEEVRSWINPDP